MRALLLSLIWLTVALAVAQVRAAGPPNVVLVVSDDQGYHDLGCYGSDEVLTQKLAEMRAAFEAWRAEMDGAEPRRPFRDF